MGYELVRARRQGVLDDTEDWNEEEFQAIYGSIFSFAIRQLDEELVREYSATPQAAAAAAADSGEEPQKKPRRTAAQVKQDMRAVHRERMRRKSKDKKAAAATQQTE